MVILLEQLADEAIRLRQQYLHAAGDRDEAALAARLADWAHLHPALDALAVKRETTLGELEAKGITAGPPCTARVVTVQLHAEPLPGLLRHVYRLTRGTHAVTEGLAWLSSGMDTTESGRYVAVDTTGLVQGHVEGDTIGRAVLNLADALCRAEQVQRAAKRGDVQ